MSAPTVPPSEPSVSVEETVEALDDQSVSPQIELAPRRRFQRASSILPPLLGLAVILLVWQFGVTLLQVPPYLVPKPSNIVAAIVDNWSQLLESVLRTMVASLSGLLLAIVLGIAAAVTLGFSRLFERSVFPYAIVLQTTPVVATAPLIVIWVGPGLRSIIVISFIISFFPMLSNTLAGLNSADLEAKSLFRLYGASRWETMWRLRLPGAMPYIMAGVRISSGLSVIGAIVGEFVAGIGGGRGGLGYIVQVASKQLNIPFLAAGALAGAILGVTYDIINRRLGRRLLAWHESAVGEEGDMPRAGTVPGGASSGD
jgi:NitT/TauT family transport system permease protein